MIIRSLVLLALLAPGVSLAHGLVVFAFVDGGDVVVEAKFSNGRLAQAGVVNVYDAVDTKLFDLPVTGGEPVRFPVDPSSGGYRIEVVTPNGHSDYWVLTPNDLKGTE
ncbi:MAG: hypothetical protein AAFR93_05180 [Pseudomonadota bacterium]